MNKIKTARWRVKRLNLSVGFSRHLVLSFRRFRTSPARRSKRNKQFVIQTDFLSIREIAIVFTRRKQSKKAAGNFFRFPRRALAPSLLIIIGLVGSVYSGLHIKQPVDLRLTGRASASSSQPVKPKAPEQPKVMARAEPTQVRIPKVGIAAPVVPTGQAADGTIAMPGPDLTGWYNGSPTPGELGPAVIVGHVDQPGNIAVFWRLRELVPGDTIEVDRADGSTATFIVTDIKQFPQDQFPTEEVYGSINFAGIRLITCGGTFNVQTGHYSHNTVVYGTLQT